MGKSGDDLSFSGGRERVVTSSRGIRDGEEDEDGGGRGRRVGRDIWVGARLLPVLVGGTGLATSWRIQRGNKRNPESICDHFPFSSVKSRPVPPTGDWHITRVNNPRRPNPAQAKWRQSMIQYILMRIGTLRGFLRRTAGTFELLEVLVDGRD